MDKPGKKQKVLIVEDSRVSLKYLTQIWDSEYEVFSATNGEEAIQLANEELPDLILLDIIMPKIDGYEVCRWLKAEPKTRNIPIIFITALDQEEDEKKGLELGAIDYINKPISEPIVKARVKNHLELKQYRDTLENLSSIDGLTGISNRRRFDETLDREWNRGVRQEIALSLIILDIDCFKAFNDNYGHLAGDECLKKVAETLSQSLRRSTDSVARYGGEEFVVLLPETDSEGAFQMGQNMRKMVESRKIPHGHCTAANVVTVSAGVATTVPQRNRGPSFLVDAADKLLYEVKKEGRNQVRNDFVI